MANPTRIHQLLNRLYEVCEELSKECDGRPCTPSGFCVGTPGEYLAADAFGLKLLPGNSKDFDAETEAGELVQIRASGKGSYIPIHGGKGLLLVVRIHRSSLELVYGGPAINAWTASRAPNHRGVRTISLSALNRLHADLTPSLRLQRIR
ncbi:hypothetical protein VB737_09320 [Synechococcus sp. BA-120 BA3]|nr:hypothetical protein [Synechococcus sp. BA-120 BA3]